MSIGEIHLILRRDDQALRDAVTLARRLHAHLTALLLEAQPEVTDYPDAARAAIRERLAEGRRAVMERTNSQQVDFSMQNVSVPLDGSIEEILSRCRLSDLVVISQAAPYDNFHQELIRGLVFDSAAPILVVPCTVVERQFERAVIAWDGRSVTAHAVQSALPLLELAQTIGIVSVVREGEAAHDVSDLARHLGRHGIRAVGHALSMERSVAATLLRYVADEGIDWVAMGGFGHGRLHEIIHGSPTIDMLRGSTVPVLMHR
ncbi:MAG: universal stress protein [Bauldia sp.]|nr:universal stress protein [Bauldia sp.]